MSSKKIIAEGSRRAFAYLRSQSPLKQLTQEDQALLWSYLKLFAYAQRDSGEYLDGFFAAASRTAAAAARFAQRLEQDIFQSPESEILAPFVTQFAGLPSQLRALNELLNANGKPGYKAEVFTNTFLIAASALVRSRLGKAYDEHVAELFQAIDAGNTELSGDAIRKKRDRLRRQYPHAYKQALQFVQSAAKSGSESEEERPLSAREIFN